MLKHRKRIYKSGGPFGTYENTDSKWVGLAGLILGGASLMMSTIDGMKKGTIDSDQSSSVVNPNESNNTPIITHSKPNLNQTSTTGILLELNDFESSAELLAQNGLHAFGGPLFAFGGNIFDGVTTPSQLMENTKTSMTIPQSNQERPLTPMIEIPLVQKINSPEGVVDLTSLGLYHNPYLDMLNNEINDPNVDYNKMALQARDYLTKYWLPLRKQYLLDLFDKYEDERSKISNTNDYYSKWLHSLESADFDSNFNSNLKESLSKLDIPLNIKDLFIQYYTPSVLEYNGSVNSAFYVFLNNLLNLGKINEDELSDYDNALSDYYSKAKDDTKHAYLRNLYELDLNNLFLAAIDAVNKALVINGMDKNSVAQQNHYSYNDLLNLFNPGTMYGFVDTRYPEYFYFKPSDSNAQTYSTMIHELNHIAQPFIKNFARADNDDATGYLDNFKGYEELKDGYMHLNNYNPFGFTSRSYYNSDDETGSTLQLLREYMGWKPNLRITKEDIQKFRNMPENNDLIKFLKNRLSIFDDSTLYNILMRYTADNSNHEVAPNMAANGGNLFDGTTMSSQYMNKDQSGPTYGNVLQNTLTGGLSYAGKDWSQAGKGSNLSKAAGYVQVAADAANAYASNSAIDANAINTARLNARQGAEYNPFSANSLDTVDKLYNLYNFLKDNWRRKDLQGSSTGARWANTGYYTLKGAADGFMAGGLWGGIAGAAAGFGGGAFGLLSAKKKARREANKLNRLSTAINWKNIRGLNDRSWALDTLNDRLNLLNYAADGGQLDIDNDTMNQYADGGIMLGGIHTNGADWQLPGNYKEINTGGTHEENPNEGVPMGADLEGTPNLVEEDEVIYNDYVFSARLKVPEARKLKGKDDKYTYEEKILKKYAGMSYADAVKKLEKECGLDERPEDNISRRAFEAEILILTESLELVRQEELMNKLIEKLKSMSPQEQLMFLQQMAQLELAQQLLEQQAQLEQMMALQLQGQEQLMSPEEQQLMMQLLLMSPEELLAMQSSPEEMLAMLQLQAMQALLPMMAKGGNLRANGGDNTEEVLGDEQNTESIENQNQSQQIPLETEEEVELEQLQELPEFDFNKDAEDMSTSELNQVIDLIIEYALNLGDRQLARAAKKIKNSNREDKIQFVDDTLDAIYKQLQELQEQLMQLLQMQEEQMQLQAMQEDPNLQALALAEQEAMMQLQLQMNPAEAMSLELINPALEMCFGGKLFASGGALDAINKAIDDVSLSGIDVKDIINYLYNNKKIEEYKNLDKFLDYSKENIKDELANYHARLINDYLINHEDLIRKYLNKVRAKFIRYYKKNYHIDPSLLTSDEAKLLFELDFQKARRYYNDKSKDGFDSKTLLEANLFISTVPTASTVSLMARNYEDAAYDVMMDRVYPNRVTIKDGKIVLSDEDKKSRFTAVPLQDFSIYTMDNFAKNPYQDEASRKTWNDYGVYDVTYNPNDLTFYSSVFGGTTPEEILNNAAGYYRQAITKKFNDIYKGKLPKPIEKLYLTNQLLKDWIKELASSSDAKDKKLSELLIANYGDGKGNIPEGDNAHLNGKKEGPTEESKSYHALVAKHSDNEGLKLEDAKAGIRHIPYVDADEDHKLKATFKRLAVEGADGKLIYVKAPENFDWSTAETNGTPVNLGNNIWAQDYVVKDTRDRVIYKDKHGNLRLIPKEDANKYKPLGDNLYANDSDVLGTTFNDHYVQDSPSKARTLGTPTVPPDAPMWPYIMGMSANLGAMIPTMLSRDTSGRLMYNATNMAALYTPIGFTPIPGKLKYNPISELYLANRALNLGNALEYNLFNGFNDGPVAMAALMNAQDKTLGAILDAITKGKLYNDTQELAYAKHNQGIDLYNSQGALLADSTNALLADAARLKYLQGAEKAITLQLLTDESKSKAISQGMLNMIDLGVKGASNDFANRLFQWYVANAGIPGVNYPWYNNYTPDDLNVVNIKGKLYKLDEEGNYKMV